MTGVRFPLGTFPSTRVGCLQQKSPVAAQPSMPRVRRSNRSLSQRPINNSSGPDPVHPGSCSSSAVD